MYIVFIVGTAGAGKSLLTAAFSDWLKMSKQDVAIVNLDPGALTLPYSPDIDIRESVNAEDLMEKYSLGPNGALVMAADLVADDVEKLSREIEELQSDVVLVDTSGQLELFAFRASGPYIANELTKENKAIVYLFDAVFSANPMNFVSNLFISAAIQSRFLQPQIHILSKCDLLPAEEVDRIIDWSASPMALDEAIDARLDGSKRLLSKNMRRAIQRTSLRPLLLPVSAKTNYGIIQFNTVLERVLAAGDKFTY
jgi:GTPase SAR1 family protein